MSDAKIESDISESKADLDERPPPGTPEKRGISEWIVVLVLVALIVGVAWSQFGGLFEESTEGDAGGNGLTVEGSGIQLGGTAMSHLPTGTDDETSMRATGAEQ